MPDNAADLYRQLTRTHPVYDKMKPEWERYRDVTEAIIDVDKYLHRTTHEDESLFDFRKLISEFVPECPLAIRSIETAVATQKPKRFIPDPDKKYLASFIDNADLNGNHIDNVNLDILRTLLTYGTTRIVISNFRPQNIQTRFDEQQQGVQPYLVDYSPLDVINWETDRLGNPEWVVIQEIYTKQQDPLSDRTERIAIIVLTKTTWTRYEFERGQDGKAITLLDIEEGAHDLGIVPIIVEPLRGRGKKKFQGDSFIKVSSRLDIRKFRYESDWNYDLYIHAHPLLVMKAAEELAVIGVGANAVLKLDPTQNEDAKYLETPTSAFEALQSAITEIRHGIYRQAGTDPLGILEPNSRTFQATGVARAWSFTTTENRVLAAVGEIMERIEQQQFDFALRYLTGKTPSNGEILFKGQISYPARYDPASIAMLLDECERLPMIINSPGFIRWKHKMYMQRTAEDIPQQELMRWEEEVDKGEIIGAPAGTLSKPNPPPPFGANPAVKILDENQDYEKAQETRNRAKE